MHPIASIVRWRTMAGIVQECALTWIRRHETRKSHGSLGVDGTSGEADTGFPGELVADWGFFHFW